ncbi:ABC transporter C family protein (macronuclear) [Tetrahymena thermophila SB210]|uniref:ABC transporter C family protein n=1 Tax=Tetrahymena thermophila (strain SB210) TaxID=312017 RepID=Q22P58_TETTS|nr:ABC transporter C family protein [Tetrahymena thermophila SB210]EAR86953.2 ABC transporter C family protein [Tetrahymena thermophila SB210]|eukprot:XP_001007198.2 ABC transporter C family protein [Tetrahymena thermophila SB210]
MKQVQQYIKDILFSNLSSLIKRIKYSKEPITNEEVRQYVRSQVSSEEIVKQIDHIKQDFYNTKSKAKSINLFSVTRKITGRSMLIGFLMYLGKNLAATFSIFLMDQITDLIKVEGDLSTSNKISICFLLCSLLLLFLLKSAFFSQYEWYQCIWKAQSQTLFQYLIYEKSLRIHLSYSSSINSQIELQPQNNNEGNENNTNNNEDEQSNPDVNNLITVDCQELEQSYWGMIELGCGVITIGLVLSLIYYRIGDAMLYGMYILFVAVFLNAITAYFLQKQYEKLYSWMDKRVALSQDVIEGIKSIKFLGWEKIFENKILDFRSKEYKHIIMTKSLDCINTIFWNCVSYFMLYSFLTNFISEEEGKSLKDSNVFTLIALFGFLQYPLLNLPWCFSLLARQNTSFKRIQSFLNETEIDEKKYQRIEDQNFTNKYMLVDEKDGYSQKREFNNQIAVQIYPLSFTYGCNNDEREQTNKNDLNQNVLEMQLIKNEKTNSNDSGLFVLNVPLITINKGTLNFVVGEIGSGKSAFLQSILNEMNILDRINNKDGKVTICGQIAYVSQNHWLQNKSIRENILFGNKLDEKWYNTCIEACELKNDLNNHPNGDNKIVGPGGSNLSGGQRQRICLCRAIYQNADIYLFDDIFSSLDTHVAENIYQNAIIQLLLKERNKTMIFVTSHYKYLQDRKYISQILYLNNGNIITDQSQVDKYLDQLIYKSSKRCSEINSYLDQQDEILEDQDSNFIQYNKKKSHQSNKHSFHTSKSPKNEHADIMKLNDYDVDINEEKLELGEISNKTIQQYIYDMKLSLFILFVGMHLLLKAIQILIDFWLGDQTTDEKQNFPFINSLFNSFYETLQALILFFLLVATLKGVLFVLCSLNSCQATFMRLNTCLMYSHMKFFDQNPVGRIISRISKDINLIDDYLTWSVNELVDQLAYSLSYPIGIMIQFPWMSLFIVFSIGIGYLISNLFREANRVIKRLNALNLAKVLTNISETKDGLSIIRSFKKQSYMVEQFLKNLSNSMNSFVVASSIQIWMIIRLLMISNMLFFFIALTILIIFVFDIDFNRNLIALSLTYSILLCEVFGNLIYYFCHTEESMISVERVRQYYSNEQENLKIPIMKLEKIKNLPINFNDPQSEQFSIVFENVFMAYGETPQTNTNEQTQNSIKNVNAQQNNQDQEMYKINNNIQETNIQNQMLNDFKNVKKQQPHYALNNINLKIRKGEKIAFCGRTGSGKTSILNALFYLYKVQSGNIFINNKNIKSLSLTELRNQLSIIPQFGFLYKSSLQGNLVPDNKISSLEIQNKLCKINLSIKRDNTYQPPNELNQGQQSNLTETIKLKQAENSYEKDLDFQIDDGGSNLSNGQKQIINFFRIVLQDTDIVCLDEATSNMDPKSDQELHKALFSFCQNKTLLVITHRLENIHEFDRVVVMEKGSIIECGHVSELKSNPNSFFNFLLANEQKAYK